MPTEIEFDDENEKTDDEDDTAIPCDNCNGTGTVCINCGDAEGMCECGTYSSVDCSECAGVGSIDPLE